MRHVIDRAGPRGLLDDHVHAAAGFLDAFEASGDGAWLERAATVMRHCATAFADSIEGGFFDAPVSGEGAGYLAARAKPIQDAPTASPNGTAALVLARLWAITGERAWRADLDRHLAAFAGAADGLSVHGAALLRAIDWAVRPVTRISVAGPEGPGAACEMHLLALQTYRPRRVVVRTVAAEPAATVCVDVTCSLPVATREALARQLA